MRNYTMEIWLFTTTPMACLKKNILIKDMSAFYTTGKIRIISFSISMMSESSQLVMINIVTQKVKIQEMYGKYQESDGILKREHL